MGTSELDRDKIETDADGKSVGFSAPINYPTNSNDLYTSGWSFGSISNGQFMTYSVDGIHVPPEFAMDRLGAGTPGFELNLLSFSAAMSQRQIGTSYTGVSWGTPFSAYYGFDGSRSVSWGQYDESLGGLSYSNATAVYSDWKLDWSLLSFQTRIIKYNNASVSVTNDSYKKDLKDRFDERLKSEKCKKAMNALLKKLGSKFSDMQALYKDVDDNGGFLQSLQSFSAYKNFPANEAGAAAFAAFDKGKRVVVANAANRNYNKLNYLNNLYNTETTTLFHELLHLARDGGTLNHTTIAENMRDVSIALGGSPITAKRNNGRDFSNPNKNNESDNSDYMNKWINTYCPAVSPPSPTR